MSEKSKILHFPAQHSLRDPIAWFCRLGTTGHQQLADIHAAGDLPLQRVVVDASMWKHQKELCHSLKQNGAELVLDTKVAELSSPGRYVGNVLKAPWSVAGDGKPMGPDLFQKAHPSDVLGQIARFAVEANVDTVLAPTHFLSDKNFGGWLDVDHQACLELREALDREGGKHIVIDYNLIFTATQLRQANWRGDVMESISDLPIQNLWLRAGSFGHDATAAGTRHYIEGIRSLNNLGLPVVADYAGGLTSIAILAFGAAGGVAHGIGERTRFTTSGWEKPPSKKHGGSTQRIVIPGLDKTLTAKEIECLRTARSGTRLLACSDRSCCKRGLADTLRQPRKHAARQTFDALSELHDVVNDRRVEHFVDQTLAKAERKTRDIAALRPNSDKARDLGVDTEKLMRSLDTHSKQLERKRKVLEALAQDVDTSNQRSPVVKIRRCNSSNNSKKHKGFQGL